MKKKLKRIRKRSICIISLICCLFLMPVTSGNAAPRTGDIDIDYEGRTDEIDDIKLSGAKFIIYPIQYKENDVLVWRDEFADCGISLEDTSSQARKEQAAKLYKYAVAHNIPGIIHVTDKNGHTSFPDLAEGIYLLAEIGSVTEGVDEFESEPFLVMIPSEVNGKFEYDVDVEPKAEWASHEGEPVGPEPGEDPQPEPGDNPTPGDITQPEEYPDMTPEQILTEPSQSQQPADTESIESGHPLQKWIQRVKTGDTTPVFMWIGLGTAAVCVIVLITKKKHI